MSSDRTASPPSAEPLSAESLSADALQALASRDFLRAAAARDVAAGRYDGQVVTRFPPEPNGYLHIGHAKAIVVDFGVARDFGGRCHLRMDDTNPTTETMEFAENIAADVRWLGFDFDQRLYFASDMYEQMYQLALRLVDKGLAYVDSSSEDEIRQRRGTVTEPGQDSPYRDRSPAESRDLLDRMRAGEFPDGSQVLRAKIDMSAPNMLLRDPILYRIKHAHHYRAGDAWCIYPMYDYAHCLEDALEGVTHSICTLEFENNRALYDWVIEATEVVPAERRPHQYEMARLEVEYIVTSKRRLKQLVDQGLVSGWDDPRMPTLAGLRRRGVPPQALVSFIEKVGVAKTNSQVEYALLDHAIREWLEPRTRRMMGVVDPVEVVVEGWGEDEIDALPMLPWLPDQPAEGGRSLPFGKRLWIDRADFEVEPPKGFKRLVPGGEVRLLGAYAVRHLGHDLDAQGRVRRIVVSVDRDTRGGDTGRKMGSIHWVPAQGAVPAELHLYDQLLLSPTPMADPSGRDFLELVNPESLVTVQGWLEPAAAELAAGDRVQLLRQGYFAVDGAGPLVLNRTTTLKDTWVRRQEQPTAAEPGTAAGTTATRPASAEGEDERRRRRKRPASEARAEARAADPALAAAMQALLQLGVGEDEAEVLSGGLTTAAFALDAVRHADPAAVARFIVHDLRGAVPGGELSGLRCDAAAIGKLVALVEAGTVTSRAARTVLDSLLAQGGDPAELVSRLGLASLSDDGVVTAAIAEILARHPDELARYRAGEQRLQGFFMGQVMQATRGKADPQLARRLLLEQLAP